MASQNDLVIFPPKYIPSSKWHMLYRLLYNGSSIYFYSPTTTGNLGSRILSADRANIESIDSVKVKIFFLVSQ